MADNETQTPDPTPETPETPEAPKGPEPVETFSREYVEELRRENARARTAKKTAVDEAKAEVKAEYEALLAEKDTAYTELQNQLGEAWIELEKVYTAIDAKVPSEKVRALAAFLQGTDKESITESAKSAKELFGGWKEFQPPVDPTQGSGGGQPLPLNGDKLLQAIMQKVGK